MQIETTLRYCFPLIRWAKIQKFGNTFCWGDHGETSPVQLTGMQNGVIPLQRNWAKASKITMCVQAGTRESHCWESTPTSMPKDGSVRLFTATLFVTAKDWKEGKCPPAGDCGFQHKGRFWRQRPGEISTDHCG